MIATVAQPAAAGPTQAGTQACKTLLRDLDIGSHCSDGHSDSQRAKSRSSLAVLANLIASLVICISKQPIAKNLQNLRNKKPICEFL